VRREVYWPGGPAGRRGARTALGTG